MAGFNEVPVGDDLYIFANSTVARAFENCLSKKSAASCVLDFRPLQVRKISLKQQFASDSDDCDEGEEIQASERP